MRIMTSSRLRSDEQAIKFKNRPEKDMIHDEEYQRYKEEKANTHKMSVILKSLNASQGKKTKKKGSQSVAVRNGGIMIHGMSTNSLGSRTKINTTNQVSNQDLNEI